MEKTKVQQIFKKYKYKPYKIRVIHNLHPGDANLRLFFCRWILQQTEVDRNFVSKVIWSDESFVSSAGLFNRNNTRYWSENNPHQVHIRERQGRFGFSVECLVLGTKIRYMIYNETLTAIKYLEILEHILPELLEDVPLANLNSIYFQQDGAPAHNAYLVRPFLEENFGNKWIGTHGPINGPPRSQDLSILDFCIWGYLKNKIYINVHRTVEDLRNATDQAFRQLQARPLILSNALEHIVKRCQICIGNQGN